MAIAMEESAKAWAHDAEESEISATKWSAGTKVHTAEESEISATEVSSKAKVLNNEESEVTAPEESADETEDGENKTKVPEITEITSKRAPKGEL